MHADTTYEAECQGETDATRTAVSACLEDVASSLIIIFVCLMGEHGKDQGPEILCNFLKLATVTVEAHSEVCAKVGHALLKMLVCEIFTESLVPRPATTCAETLLLS